MNNVLRHILRITVLILIQSLIINNLHWLGVFHPYVYIIGLLLLPPTLPRWAEMLIATAVGLIMDAICSSAGVHMAACVAVAYFRPLLIMRLTQDAKRISSQICSATMGDWQFIIMAALMILLHHAMVFLLEAWNMHHIWWILLTTLLSSAVTFLLTFFYDRSER